MDGDREAWSRVRGSPSFWYVAAPIAFSRLAEARA
jgi:hypothetical protein